jgi:hypothetical protein
MKKEYQKRIVLLGLISIALVGSLFFLNQHNKPLFQKDYYYEDFEDQFIGQEPLGWFEHKNSDQAKVKELDSDNKVCYVWDTTDDNTELVKRFGKAKKGEIEFQILGLDYKKFTVQVCQRDSEYALKDDIILDFADTTSIRVQINKDHTRVNSFKINTWYNIKIKFDVEDNWQLWIDGNGQGEFDYYETPWYFSQLYFYTHTTLKGEDYGFYIDNVSISILERY